MSGSERHQLGELRAEVRGFLAEQLAAGTFQPQCDGWLTARDPAFSQALGHKGWLGITWPRSYGGQERTAFERFVVTEELVAAGAPVAAHWIADRQIGPNLLKYGSVEQKQRLLPGIAAGELFFCIGMSEPDAGSDLAAVRTRATKSSNGWVLNGRKIWTTGAQSAHFMMALVRTSGAPSDRHQGLSQVLVDLSAPGVEVRPIRSLDRGAHFNEVTFTEVALPPEALVGSEGGGWRQVMSELAFERSGPERFLSTAPLLLSWLATLGPEADAEITRAVGRLLARLWSLRQASWTLTAQLAAGDDPVVGAAMLKDRGTAFEREVIDVVRRYAGVVPDRTSDIPLQRLLAEAVLASPGFTLRGGTTEIMRSIVAKSLGVA